MKAPTGKHPKRHEHSLLRDAVHALLIVVLLEWLTMWAETTQWWEAHTVSFHDGFMRIWTGQDIVPDASLQFARFAFIDIDDATFAQWGAKGVTDRAHVRDLIRFAAEGKAVDSDTAKPAALIVVDLDLSHPGPGDDDLRSWLHDYHSGPDIIFVRPLSSRHPGRIAPPDTFEASAANATEIDAAVKGNDLVHFATANFVLDPDGLVRRWHLSEAVCENSRPVALPSVELLSLAIVGDAKSGVSRLGEGLKDSVAGDCDDVKFEPGREIEIGRLARVDLHPDDIDGERILFTQAWPINQRNERRLTYLPARIVTENAPSADPVEGRIVIVGGSNAAARDRIQTPIGAMPGSMVLLNAINALLQQGQLHPLPPMAALGLGLFVGMAVWLSLTVFTLAISPIIAIIFVICTSFAVSEMLIGGGIWIDPAAPFAGLAAHWLLEIGETVMHTWKKHGWRALLAERFRSAPLAVLLATGLGLGWTHAACAGDAPVSGHISDMQGDPANFWIERDGQKKPVAYWTNVRAGDRIFVNGPGYVKILPSGLSVTRESSPGIVRKSRETTVVESIAEGFGRLINPFSGQENGSHSQQTVTVFTRDLANLLAVPLLTEPYHQRLTAGTRGVTLAWSAGTPPFVATLTGESGSFQKLTPDADGARRASAPMTLAPGRYEFEVTDMIGSKSSAVFEAVDGGPDIDETAFATDPDDVRLVMKAVRIAQVDGGRWRLEAFQRLSAAASTNGVARLLAARLAAGKPADLTGR
nr:CHASE2 domain-containing protein [uncultured Rhodopila sp.]